MPEIAAPPRAVASRPLAGLCLLSALAALASLAIVRGERGARRPAAGTTAPMFIAGALVMIHLLGLWTHPIYAFLLVALALAALAGPPDRRWLGPAAAAVALGVYFVTWGPVLRETMALPATAWMPAPRPQHLIDAFTLLWGNRNAFILVGVLLTLVLLAPGRAVEALRAPASRLVVIAGILGILLPFAVSYARPVFLTGRTPILVLPLAAVATAILTSQLGRKALLVALSAIFVQGSVQWAASNYRLGDVTPTRESVAQVAAAARCGDTLVMSGLSYSGVEYYLRRLDAPACLARETFPRDIQTHPGWIDTRRLAAEREQLVRDATDRAARFTAPGSRVWLFGWDRGIGHEASTAARLGFDSQLPLREHLELKGTFFGWIRVYEAAPPPTP